MLGLLAATQTFKAPYLDYHALAPEIVLTATLMVAIVVDLVTDETRKYLVTLVTTLGLLASIVPIFTLAGHGISHTPRVMFDGAYVVDTFALVLKALLLFSGFVVMLLSVQYIEEGDFYEGEYAYLLISSLLGMTIIVSARDLISIFVALELLSIPAYLLAGWRKRDRKSNEAALKYYLLGVLSSGVMVYGMSLVYGFTGQTNLYRIADYLRTHGGHAPIVGVAVFFVLIGFCFKISAVPFHLWAPDTYEGAPTPITAFLSVASKTAGFAAILELVFVAFVHNAKVWHPLFWTLAILTMTIGNLTALRQTNVVRMLAYSSVAQAGYMLVPLAVARTGSTKINEPYLTATLTYLLIYAAMNLGAFAVVIAVSRKTRSGEISSWGGLFTYAPGMATVMGVFMFSLAGIPPLGGWFAKFVIIRAVFAAGDAWAVALAVVVAVNSVIALFYYGNVARQMFFQAVPEGIDAEPVVVPSSLLAGIGLTSIVTVVSGIAPNLLARLGDLSTLVR